MGRVIRGLGAVLVGAGIAALGGIFALILLNGGWPDYLEPVRAGFAALSEVTGSWQFPVLVGIFVGPGGLLFMIGDSIAASENRRKMTKK